MEPAEAKRGMSLPTKILLGLVIGAVPEIVLSKVPAVLITIDGEPLFQKIENTSVLRVVNSPVEGL